MNVLLFPVGSHGDVHPFVGLGMALKARGHGVTLITNEHFAGLAGKVGLEFVGLGTEDQFLRITEDPRLWKGFRGFEVVMRAIAQLIRPVHDTIVERYEPGRTIVLGSLLAFGARVAQDQLGIPFVSVHLQPGVFRSAIEPPVWPFYPLIKALPPWVRKGFYRIADALLVDPVFVPELHAYRKELGLPRIHRLPHWWNSPLGNLCLFPDWYGPPQPDWPANNVVLTGFPLFDEGRHETLAPKVEAFLAEGSPPIIFTAGSAMKHGHDFFRTAVEACERLGRRGLLLARFADQVPANLPDQVRHFAYIPFSQVLPRAAAIVHHGGIGTIAQSLAAGIPQLVMPMAHDQPDNAARLERLGVGRGLPPRRFRTLAVTRVLGELLGSSQVAERCRELASRVREGDSTDAACRALESMIERFDTSRLSAAQSVE